MTRRWRVPALAASLFNRTWTLLDKPDRSEEESELMVHTAHASRLHWEAVGTDENRAEGIQVDGHKAYYDDGQIRFTTVIASSSGLVKTPVRRPRSRTSRRMRADCSLAAWSRSKAAGERLRTSPFTMRTRRG